MTIRARITGAKELDRKFKRLASDSIRLKVVRKAARAGGTVIAKTVRRNAPTVTKTLKKNIRQKVKWYRGSGTIVSVIGARSRKVDGRNPANYLHLVEHGFDPHFIRGPLAFDAFGRTVVVGEVQHPGFTGHKFMDRSFRESQGKAFRVFQDKYRAEIMAEARK